MASRPLARLVSDHDDAVGTAGTVQGVRGGVLQDGHGLDVIRVDVVQVTLVRSAVHDEERLLAGADRAESADSDRRRRARGARGVGQLHAGYLTGQCLSDVRSLYFGDIIRFDDAGRTGEGLFLGLTESDHDHIVDALRVLLQYHLQIGLAVDGDHLALVTDERNHQITVHRGTQSKLSGDVGRRTRGRRSLYKHGGSYDRIAVLAAYSTRYLLVLGHCHGSYAQNRN